jgi:hypothetical protein
MCLIDDLCFVFLFPKIKWSHCTPKNLDVPPKMKIKGYMYPDEKNLWACCHKCNISRMIFPICSLLMIYGKNIVSLNPLILLTGKNRTAIIFIEITDIFFFFYYFHFFFIFISFFLIRENEMYKVMY